jgi:phospholipid/cholesterol/gamma-HCH transport system substrate-binding protein
VKINNETKIGIIGVITVILFVLGFNFLKGKTIFSNNLILYSKFQDIQGLATSNPVVIKGLEVGKINAITIDKNMNEIKVEISINKDINIPSNSIAIVSPNPLSITKLEIKFGDAQTYLKSYDTISASPSEDFIGNMINSKVDPLLSSAMKSINSIDSILINANKLLNEDNKRNLSATIENLNKITSSFVVSSASLQNILDKDKGSLTKTLNNVNSFTENLAANNEKINGVINNLDKTSNHLSALDLQKTLTSLDSTINSLKTTLNKTNSKDGTIGLLLNDPTLYKNLTSTSNKINILLDDLRVHPKRYVSLSLFGKKSNETPLSEPLPDTINAPYLKSKN